MKKLLKTFRMLLVVVGFIKSFNLLNCYATENKIDKIDKVENLKEKSCDEKKDLKENFEDKNKELLNEKIKIYSENNVEFTSFIEGCFCFDSNLSESVCDEESANKFSNFNTNFFGTNKLKDLKDDSNQKKIFYTENVEIKTNNKIQNFCINDFSFNLADKKNKLCEISDFRCNSFFESEVGKEISYDNFEKILSKKVKRKISSIN